MSTLTSQMCVQLVSLTCQTLIFQAHREPGTERSLRGIGQRVSRGAARRRALWPAGRQLSQVAEQPHDAPAAVIHGHGVWRRPQWQGQIALLRFHFRMKLSNKRLIFTRKRKNTSTGCLIWSRSNTWVALTLISLLHHVAQLPSNFYRIPRSSST